MRSLLRIFIDFLQSILQSRKMIGTMVVNDFKVKYASSALGVVWAFIQPTIQIAVLIFVFAVGFRSGPTSTGVPFALWLICGLVPWNFFADALTNGTNSLIEYSYLVKKVVFRTSILPIVKSLSALIIHSVFVVIIFIVALAFGFTPTLYTLQILFYLPCLLFLIIGINWLSSALAAFFRDISQLINIILQLFIWLTPILWSSDILPARLAFIFKLNPIYFIVQGYRDAFTGSTWFWEKPWWTLYYLVFSGITFVGGAFLFHKLRPHFSDVL
jgi:ABC-type polysaccharide/polyol phosphate export permease